MRTIVILILSFLFTIPTALGQKSIPDDSGFTNKAEAKNLTVNGVKEGKWIEYFNGDGENIYPTSYRLIIYKAGKPYGIMRQYYDAKHLYMETPFIDGNYNGIVKEYYKSGKLWRETPCSNDRTNGIGKEYYENGKLKSETTYTNGIAGDTKYYDENGNEIK